MYVASGAVDKEKILKRFAIWVGVLTVAAAAGFGLGALTYVPPDPEMNAAPGSPSIASSEPSVVMPGHEIIPDLVGMQRATAEKQLDDLGVLFLVNPVGDKDEDLVVSQNPAAGTPVGKAKHVLLTVRCLAKPCPMPPEGKQMYDPCACLSR